MTVRIDSVEALVRIHEGRRLLAYDDATGQPIGPGDRLEGHPTIGIGRALDVRGVSEAEADQMLAADLAWTTSAIDSALAWASGCDSVRRAVLVDMAFNLGVRGLRNFKRTLAALEAGDHELAAIEMLDSQWAEQVGRRATRLAVMMRSGRWPLIQ